MDHFTSALLSIYDQLIVTDKNGTILKSIGTGNSLFHTVKSANVGGSIKDVEQDLFSISLAQEIMGKNEKRSFMQSSWQGPELLMTAYPIESGAWVWAYKEIKDSYPDTPRGQSGPLLESKKPSFPFVIRSKPMLDVLHKMQMVCDVSATVLLLGESGVGKEIAARAIHNMGNRSDGPFIPVNCGAIPENLIESELFGYVEGAFTSARKDGAKGKFTLAHKGILFLDEVGELPLNVQVKLLRVLQERIVTPIGSTASHPVDIQVIAATNKSLEKMVKKGEFREDLYYRLHVVPIHLPPLRNRVDEIPHLVQFFLQKYNALYNRKVAFTPDAIDLLCIYQWPGNVRELENTVERLVITSGIPEVDVALVREVLPFKGPNKPTSLPVIDFLMPLQEAVDLVEEQLINMAMEQYKSLKLAAKVLEVSQPTMSRKYKKLRNKIEEASFSPVDKRAILEEQINQRLRSIAVVTAAIIPAEEVISLQKNMNRQTSYSQKLKQKLTMIQEKEGVIEWVFIFIMTDDGRLIHLVADKGFVIEPGEEYMGPPEMVNVAYQAFNGKAGVTPIYEDRYGEWKTSFAPIIDDDGTIVAIVGCDYSKAYFNSEMQRLRKQLNIHV
ncbi:sigma 54-interacting transcriptional regulator [Peribacillus simplex]|uniref:HTH-type transcriptional regulatory protein TyrR n=2 Tax=Peribacillus TaxID=2675229 RepID=A0AA90T1Y3_9BACI|nr:MULTISPECIES: sigma 54-interacting transcriptional regulator [Peribacillus]MDP1419869.1 sigma 54-interacting transcriptional regulator [Peribacillus simplex]MDP1452729.1 sigma 54-interacting transcriptional regulator [Peribacillus frigoritolerans]